jgi:hypothetical protein
MTLLLCFLIVCVMQIRSSCDKQEVSKQDVSLRANPVPFLVQPALAAVLQTKQDKHFTRLALTSAVG